MSGSLSMVFGYIEQHRDAFVDELCDLVRLPSVSAERSGQEAYADAIQTTMRRAGLETRVLPWQGAPVVYGERIADGAGPTVLIYGHYDVQPVDPLDEWVSLPFEPTVRDGRVYGRGSSDNKGQHLAQLLALRAWLEAAGHLPVNVKVILEGEEEVGSPHFPAFVEQHRGLLAADLALTSDGPLHESGRPLVVLGVRGILYVELRARGASQDVHSGNRGGVVPNPAWRLIDVLATMRDTNGRVLVDGFYDAVKPPTESERAAIDRLPLDLPATLAKLGTERLPPPEGLGYYDRLMLQPTMNVCGFHSGYGGPGMKTIVPSTATVKIDMRLVPDQDPNEIFELVVRHVHKRAPEVEVERLGSMLPSRTSADNPYTRAVIAGVTEAYGVEPYLVPSLGGSLPNYVFTKLLGLPSLLVPYANADQANHAPNENFEIEKLIRGVRAGAAILDRVAEVGAAR